MGKHNQIYPPVERDLYPTPAWVTDILARHLNLNGARVWEFACGRHDMVLPMRRHGAIVYATDIVDYGDGQDEVMDFSVRPRTKAFELHPSHFESALRQSLQDSDRLH